MRVEPTFRNNVHIQIIFIKRKKFVLLHFIQVPQVFIDGKSYGGGSDIKKLHEEGELQKILKK